MLPGRSPAEIKRIIGPKSRGALQKYQLFENDLAAHERELVNRARLGCVFSRHLWCRFDRPSGDKEDFSPKANTTASGRYLPEQQRDMQISGQENVMERI